MKGLLLKDAYTLTKQMKIYVMIILVFAALPGASFISIGLVYAAMLPITALSYDERAHWNELAAMMPYSAFELVFSKYLLGYISVTAASLVSVASQYIIAAVKHSTVEADMLFYVVTMACVAAVLLALNLPIMFKSGVEKGRIAFYILIGSFVAGATLMPNVLETKLSQNLNFWIAAVLILAGTALLSAASVALSVKLYKSRIS